MAFVSPLTWSVSTKERVDDYVRNRSRNKLSGAEVERLVLARLTDEWEEPTTISCEWFCAVEGEWYTWKRPNLYKRLRYSATKRCYRQERALAMKYNYRPAKFTGKGRRSSGFYSYKAYAPKRSWMQGRPRK